MTGPNARGHAAVRLPVQVGTSALKLLARALAMLIPAFVTVMLAPVLAINIVGWRNIGSAQVLQYIFWGSGSVVTIRAVGMLARAYRRRPSDVLLDAETVRFDGGRHHGFELGWSDVQPETWSIEPTKGSYRLRSGTGSETDLVLAETHDPEERRSLEDLLQTLQTIARTKTGADAPRIDVPPGVLCCSRCGAPVAPEDAASVPCSYCNVPCAVPEPLRVRIREGRAQAARRSASAEIVTRLLRQPGAPLTARLLVGAAGTMLAAWLLAFGWMFAHLWNGVLDWEKAIVLALFPMALILALFCGLRALFANRSALSLVAFHLGAGATPGGLPACRRCAGPLAAPEAGSPIATCAYCGTENVLGLEIVRGTSVEAEHLTLEALLTHRKKERASAAWLALGAVALSGLAAALLVRGV